MCPLLDLEIRFRSFFLQHGHVDTTDFHESCSEVSDTMAPVVSVLLDHIHLRFLGVAEGKTRCRRKENKCHMDKRSVSVLSKCLLSTWRAACVAGNPNTTAVDFPPNYSRFVIPPVAYQQTPWLERPTTGFNPIFPWIDANIPQDSSTLGLSTVLWFADVGWIRRRGWGGSSG